MYMSVPIGSCGSYDPVITLKPLWGSLGTELSTWSTGSLCCIRAIQHSRLASRPLRSYTAIQRYTALYTIQLYIAIHYTGYTTPLWPATDLVLQPNVSSQIVVGRGSDCCCRPPLHNPPTDRSATRANRDARTQRTSILFVPFLPPPSGECGAEEYFEF